MLISKLMSLMPCYITLIPQCMLTQPISVITKLSSCYHHIVITLSLTSSCCTLYLPPQNYTILPSYCHLIVINVLTLYNVSCSTKTFHFPYNYLHLTRTTPLISCNQPTKSWRLIKLSGCNPFCVSIIARRKHT